MIIIIINNNNKTSGIILIMIILKYTVEYCSLVEIIEAVVRNVEFCYVTSYRQFSVVQSIVHLLCIHKKSYLHEYVD